MGGRRKTETDYENLAEENNLRWCGDFPKTTRHKTGWACSQGHLWKTTYSHIQQGRKCPHCSGHTKRTESDYKELASRCGFLWVDKFPQNTNTRTEWECSLKHRWKTTYGAIRSGTGCPVCAGNARLTVERYNDVCLGRDIKWNREKIPKNSLANTEWLCLKCNYAWLATYNNIRKGKGCPRCARRIPLTKQDYHALAKKRGFLWVGQTLPQNNQTNTEWKCLRCGNVWDARYGNISFGRGCPHCVNMVNGAQVSSQQKAIAHTICGKLNFSAGNKRIDIALPDERIAIEYDCWFWHGGQEERDKERVAFLNSLGWCVVTIRALNKVPTKQQLEDAIEKAKKDQENVVITLEDWGVGRTAKEAWGKN